MTVPLRMRKARQGPAQRGAAWRRGGMPASKALCARCPRFRLFKTFDAYRSTAMPSHAAIRAGPAGEGAAAPSLAPGGLFNGLTDEMLGRVFAALGRKAGVSPAAAAAAPGLGLLAVACPSPDGS